MIKLKTPQEIELMREGGHILAEILDQLEIAAKPGVKTRELDIIARQLLKEKGVESWFPKVNNFPGVICTSVNEEVVHGIPSDRILKEDDLLKIDLGVIHKNLYTDSARSLIVGKTKNLK